MARQAPAGLLGIHVNLPATVPPEVAAAPRHRRARAGGTLREGARGVRLARHVLQEVHGLRCDDGDAPQTIGYALADSPAGLAAWIYDYNNGEPERLLARTTCWTTSRCTWLTNTATSAARLTGRPAAKAFFSRRAEDGRDPAPGRHHGVSGGGYRARNMGPARLSRPRSTSRGRQGRALRGLEQPELFSSELRAAFRPLRPAHYPRVHNRKAACMETTRILAVAVLSSEAVWR